MPGTIGQARGVGLGLTGIGQRSSASVAFNWQRQLPGALFGGNIEEEVGIEIEKFIKWKIHTT